MFSHFNRWNPHVNRSHVVSNPNFKRNIIDNKIR